MKIHPKRPETKYVAPNGKEYDFLKCERHFLKHINKGKGGYVVCTGVRKTANGLETECLAHIYADPQTFGFDFAADAQIAKSRSSSYNVISGWVEEWFHLVKNDKSDGSGTYTTRELCTGRYCEHCKRNAPKVFGSRFYHAFSWSAWKYVVEPLNEELEKYCKCGGYITPIAYVCKACEGVLEHMTDQCPSCGSDDLYIEADPSKRDCHSATCNQCQTHWELLEARDEVLRKKVTNPMTCPHCNHEGLPKLILECSEEGCDGHPHSIYDCQLVIHKESEEQTAHTKISAWSIQEPDPKLFDPKFQGDDEIGEKIAKRNHEDVPLDKIDDFIPDLPHEQARILNKKNPFVESGEEDPTRHTDWSTPDV